MTKIALLVSMSNKYYNAGTKPFVDITLGLIKGFKNITPFLIFFNSPSYEDSKKRFNWLPAYSFHSLDEVNSFIEKQGIEAVIFDDYIYRLKLINKVKTRKKVVYVQHLVGMSVINNVSNKFSFKLRVASYLPCRLVTRQYLALLDKADVIIGNSYTATHYLASLFGLSSSGVVYPPVGVNLKPGIDGSETTNRKGILVYMGHKPDFHVRDLDSDVKVLRRVDEIVLWGEGGLEDITDEELARLYANVKLVYSSTSFELFGYVGAEALLFKTPVLLNVYQPFLERIPMDTNMVKILGRSELKKEVIEEFLTAKKDAERARDAVITNYSAEVSAASLVEILKKEIGL